MFDNIDLVDDAGPTIPKENGCKVFLLFAERWRATPSLCGSTKSLGTSTGGKSPAACYRRGHEQILEESDGGEIE